MTATDPPTVQTLAEYTDFVGSVDANSPLLLQCGSPQCARCPAFSARIEQLRQAFRFTWVYTNTREAEEGLFDELGVAKLPAFRLVYLGEADTPTVVTLQNASPADVSEAVRAHCPNAFQFVVDEDF